jgi:hypothetical protein
VALEQPLRKKEDKRKNEDMRKSEHARTDEQSVYAYEICLRS